MTDPCHPIIDLTDISCNGLDHDDVIPQNDSSTLNNNSVMELIYEPDVRIIESTRTQLISTPRRSDRWRARGGRGGRRRCATTRRYNNEPIEIIDSPLTQNTDVPNYRRKVGKNSIEKKHQSQQNEDIDDSVRDRSPLGGNFGVCPICLETLGKQPLVSTKCGHVYCQKCLTQALRSEKKCPTCRKALRGNTAYHPLFLNRG